MFDGQRFYFSMKTKLLDYSLFNAGLRRLRIKRHVETSFGIYCGVSQAWSKVQSEAAWMETWCAKAP